jgi:hypothetical protein
MLHWYNIQYFTFTFKQNLKQKISIELTTLNFENLSNLLIKALLKQIDFSKCFFEKSFNKFWNKFYLR